MAKSETKPTFEIKVAGISDLFELLNGLYKTLGKLGQIPATRRKKFLKGLKNTADLIDQTLTMLKGHLGQIILEVELGNPQKAKKLIKELTDAKDWEGRYRKFGLCDSLKEAGRELHSFINTALINKVSFKKPKQLFTLIDTYIANEESAARLIKDTLINLSKLSARVDRSKKHVLSELEKAQGELQKWRDRFIDLEREFSKAI